MSIHPDQCSHCGRFPNEVCNSSSGFAKRQCPRTLPIAVTAVAIVALAVLPQAAAVEILPPPPRANAVTRARAMGYTGDICSDCSNFTMVRNGTCLKCDTCGSTSGCS